MNYQPIDITNAILKTPRLTLRAFSLDDLEDLYEYASVPGVGEKAGWKHHESKEESKAILEMFLAEKKTFAIVKDDKVIGSLGIEKYNEALLPKEYASLQGREIGFVLAKPYWGQGLVKEAAEAVLGYLFKDLGLDFVVATHALANPQSARVQEKLGMVFIKEFEYQDRMGNAYPSKLNLITKQAFLKVC